VHFEGNIASFKKPFAKISRKVIVIVPPDVPYCQCPIISGSGWLIRGLAYGRAPPMFSAINPPPDPRAKTITINSKLGTACIELLHIIAFLLC
jgi:hypothetical protein